MAVADDAAVARALRDAVERVAALPKSRETRAFIAAGSRLGAALAAPRPGALLDAGARADVAHAVRDARDVVARAGAAPRAALLEERRRRFRVGSRAALRAPDRRALDAAARRVEATAQVALYKARQLDPARLMDAAGGAGGAGGAPAAGAGAAGAGGGGAGAFGAPPDDAPAQRAWEFSLVKSPITPLSARDLDRAPHGALLPALWRGLRVSVRVMRRDRARFYAEGDYLHKLGESPSVPRLLGGHWQGASQVRSSDADVGYLVLEVVHGASLDKLVRQRRLAATLNQLRVLDRIVTALLHAQTVVPALSHQDLHPGNIFLVPTSASSPLSCTLTPPPDAQKSSPPSPAPPLATPVSDDDQDIGSATSEAASVIVNDAPNLDNAGSDASSSASAAGGPTAPAEPGSPVRSDATLDARVRRAASTAAARGDVALARGMLSMHSMHARLRASVSQGTVATASASTLSQRATAALLGATRSAPHAPAPVLPAPRAPAAYLVKVLDFAPADEARGRRASTSWANANVAGYCAPEMATPRMWRRAGDHRQRGKLSALRAQSADVSSSAAAAMPAMLAPPPEQRRRSSSSSNNTSSAVVHTPAVPRPASPRMAPRSLSYPRKSAAPLDSAEGVMFADDDAFNRHAAALPFEPAFGRVHSLDSAHYADARADTPRRGKAGAAMPRPSAREASATAPQVRYVEDLLDGDDDDIRDVRRPSAMPYKRRPDDDDGRLRRTGREEVKRLGNNIYRRISAHHDRARDTPDATKGSTNLTANILGNVLGVAAPAKSFDSRAEKAGPTLDTSEERNLAIGKVDVWSLGWLLYYMATGEHPPSDAWASVRPLGLIDMTALAPQVADVVKMCVVPDVSKRSSLAELKRRLESHMRQALFMKGLSLLESAPRHAFHLLDKVVGIKAPRHAQDASLGASFLPSFFDAGLLPVPGVFTEASEETVDFDMSARRNPAPAQRADSAAAPREKRPRGGAAFGRMPSSFSEAVVDVRAQSIPAAERSRAAGSPGGAVGLNGRTRAALSTLPLVIVRRVEWEFYARKYECSAKELSRLRAALICERWTKSEVYDGELAIAYLRRRCAQGVAAAQSALGWVYRWGAGGAGKEVCRAMRLWEAAMESADPEAANGLGLIYHHGRRDVAVDGRRAQRYYEIAVEQGYPAAAVNLGVMLHDGAAGLPMDGLSAKALYELACENGDAIAANNLGLLLQHGAPGVDKDGAAAARAYELAIMRGERNHARRNLGELLWEGAGPIRADIPLAIEQLALAIEEGDAPSRAAAQNKLRALISRDRDAVRKSLTRSLRKKYGEILLS